MDWEQLGDKMTTCRVRGLLALSHSLRAHRTRALKLRCDEVFAVVKYLLRILSTIFVFPRQSSAGQEKRFFPYSSNGKEGVAIMPFSCKSWRRDVDVIGSSCDQWAVV